MALPLPPLNLNTNQRSEQSGLTGGASSVGVTTGARLTVSQGVPVVWLVLAGAAVALYWLKTRKA